jgi:predicted ArsR family transcriptional regulator
MSEKIRTIMFIKEKREVPDRVKDNLKTTGKIQKMILNSLKSGPKTIPQIADETELEKQIVMYHLMTLRKYGKIEVDSLDDMDEFYLYRLKGNSNDKN